MSKTIEEVVEQLKRDPGQPVRATLGGLTVEVRAVPDLPGDRSAAERFAVVGPWAGETTEEILAILAKARAQGADRKMALCYARLSPTWIRGGCRGETVRAEDLLAQMRASS